MQLNNSLYLYDIDGTAENFCERIFAELLDIFIIITITFEQIILLSTGWSWHAYGGTPTSLMPVPIYGKFITGTRSDTIADHENENAKYMMRI